MSETDTELFGVLVEGRPLQSGEAISLPKEEAAFLRRGHYRASEPLAQANILIVVEIAALGPRGLPAFVGLIRPIKIKERISADQIEIKNAARGDDRADLELARDCLEEIGLPPHTRPEFFELYGRHEKLRRHAIAKDFAPVAIGV